MLLPWTRININCRKLRCVSRTIHDLSVWNKLWSTHVNIVRLTEPIRRCVRWRMQVFKIEGFVCKRFVLSPPPPPLSFFGPRFVSRAVITENPFPRSFIAPKPNGNACYAGYYCVAFNKPLFTPGEWKQVKCLYWKVSVGLYRSWFWCPLPSKLKRLLGKVPLKTEKTTNCARYIPLWFSVQSHVRLLYMFLFHSLSWGQTAKRDSGFWIDVYTRRAFCWRKISLNVLYCYSS